MKTAYLISNIEEYGKFMSFFINHDITVFRVYWDEREKGNRCFNIDWGNKRCYYSSKGYYFNEGYEIITPTFECNQYGDYEFIRSNSNAQ